jgi:hypothetical protein
MRFLILFLFIICGSREAFADDPSKNWTEFSGCYETLSYNGAPTKGSENPDNQGLARMSDSFFWGTMPGVSKTSWFEFFLFLYDEPDASTYKSVWIFTDYGNTTVSSDSKIWSYSFHGPMLFRDPLDANAPMEEKYVESDATITRLDESRLEVHSRRKVEDRTEYFKKELTEESTVVVKRVECATFSPAN